MWKNCSTSFVQIATYKPRKTQSYRNALLDFIWIKPRAGITMTNSTPFSPITASSPQTWLIWARKACSLFSAMLSEVVFVFLFFFFNDFPFTHYSHTGSYSQWNHVCRLKHDMTWYAPWVTLKVKSSVPQQLDHRVSYLSHPQQPEFTLQPESELTSLHLDTEVGTDFL